MVSFGAAPALIAYEWAPQGAGTLGLDRCLRLLRLRRAAAGAFQRQHGVVDKRYFQGLPSPAAAALVAGFIWVMNDIRVQAGAGGLLGHVRRHAVLGPDHGDQRAVLQLQGHQMKKSVPFAVIVLIALGIAVINIDPPIVLFGLFVRLRRVAATSSMPGASQGPADQRDQHLYR